MQQFNSYQSADVVNPQLLDFIKDKLDSLAKWDLIQFFHRSPGIQGTAPRIATLTGRDLRGVEQELKDMVKTGLLEVENSSGVKVYRLSRDHDVRLLVGEFIRACDDREFREGAIYATLQSKR